MFTLAWFLGIDAVSAGMSGSVENRMCGYLSQPRTQLTVVNYRGLRPCSTWLGVQGDAHSAFAF